MGDLITFYICIFGIAASVYAFNLSIMFNDLPRTIFSVIFLIISIIGAIGSFIYYFVYLLEQKKWK